MEDLLLELKEAIEHGGGGGGTSDYTQLTNKPQVNGVTLTGNKTSSDLGLMDHYDIDERPTESSENLISSKAVWSADEEIKDELQGSKTAGSTDGSPFEIPDYGMTESIAMYFKPTQDLHGYDKPWAGGAGKNVLKMTVDDIKAVNTSGTWNGNEYTINDVTIYLLTDIDNNIIGVKVNGTASDNVNFVLSTYNKYLENGDYKLNGCPAGGSTSGTTYYLGFYIQGRSVYNFGNGDTNISIDGTEGVGSNVYIHAHANYNCQNLIFRPMIRLSTETDADFEPYSNICPISGQDNATFSWTDDEDIETEVSMNFGNTYYGGFCQFNGQIYPDWDYIASYNGETLSGEWVSDRDEYVAGTTPTIGAEVAYKTTPSYVRVTPPANLNLTEDYPIEYNGYMASIGYQPKNTVLAEAKKYTNQEIAKLGLPQPPTTDGTYHLECSVSSGIPTIRWVSNS